MNTTKLNGLIKTLEKRIKKNNIIIYYGRNGEYFLLEKNTKLNIDNYGWLKVELNDETLYINLETVYLIKFRKWLLTN